MNLQKHQIIFIGGGEAFNNEEEYLQFLVNRTYDPYVRFPSWKKWLSEGLSDCSESFTMDMPSKQNAFYPAWKIWFEKLFPYLQDTKIVIVANSLGGIFIAKYLSENSFPKPIKQLHLVAPVFDNDGLVGESVASFAFDPIGLQKLSIQADEVHIWGSVDDPVVPHVHTKKYHNLIKNSVIHVFQDRGHFFGQPSFVELFLEIKKIFN